MKIFIAVGITQRPTDYNMDRGFLGPHYDRDTRILLKDSLFIIAIPTESLK